MPLARGSPPTMSPVSLPLLLLLLASSAHAASVPVSPPRLPQLTPPLQRPRWRRRTPPRPFWKDLGGRCWRMHRCVRHVLASKSKRSSPLPRSLALRRRNHDNRRHNTPTETEAPASRTALVHIRLKSTPRTATLNTIWYLKSRPIDPLSKFSRSKLCPLLAELCSPTSGQTRSERFS